MKKLIRKFWRPYFKIWCPPFSNGTLHDVFLNQKKIHTVYLCPCCVVILQIKKMQLKHCILESVYLCPSCVVILQIYKKHLKHCILESVVHWQTGKNVWVLVNTPFFLKNIFFKFKPTLSYQSCFRWVRSYVSPAFSAPWYKSTNSWLKLV